MKRLMRTVVHLGLLLSGWCALDRVNPDIETIIDNVLDIRAGTDGKVGGLFGNPPTNEDNLPRAKASDLKVSGVYVRYSMALALNNVSFDVAPGEFISILGPSGCGKSTLLRVVAGLEPAAAGTVSIGGRLVNGLRPKDRGVAFVFQSYALYPHMTCRQNLAAPLAMTELSWAGRSRVFSPLLPSARKTRLLIEERVKATADLLGITAYLDRKPQALSGGQRQRVALGRALIRRPDLFLLDEPLANLDASLRNQTRSELRALQQRIGATTLFVTHDQSEAMAISDRVILMFDGQIRQIGTPDELYRYPADLQVARFLSQPHLNVLQAADLRKAIGDRVRQSSIMVAGQPLAEITGVIAFRPEHASIRPLQGPGLPGLPVIVQHAEHGGVEANLFVRAKKGGDLFVIRIPSGQIAHWPAGREGLLHFTLDAAHVFDPADPGQISQGNADIAALAVA